MYTLRTYNFEREKRPADADHVAGCEVGRKERREEGRKEGRKEGSLATQIIIVRKMSSAF